MTSALALTRRRHGLVDTEGQSLGVNVQLASLRRTGTAIDLGPLGVVLEIAVVERRASRVVISAVQL